MRHRDVFGARKSSHVMNIISQVALADDVFYCILCTVHCKTDTLLLVSFNLNLNNAESILLLHMMSVIKR